MLLLALYTLVTIIALFSAIIIFFSLFSGYTIFKTKVPWAKTPKENIAKILDELDLPKNALVYDLGCGDGIFLFEAEKRGLRAKGFELSLYPYLKCLFLKKKRKSTVQIVRKNFFVENLGDADAVFVFLVRDVMQKVGEKLKQDLKSGTPVVSYGFEIPGWEVKRVVETEPSRTFVYIV